MRTRARAYLIPSLLLFVAFLLFAGHLKQNQRDGIVSSITLNLASPILELTDGFFDRLRTAYQRYIKLVKVAEENEVLRERLGQMEWELNSYREMALANERYRKLFDFRFASGFESLTARIVSRDMTSWSSSLLLDRGSQDGVRTGLCVVTDLGVVGQIIGVSARTCQVQTLVHPDSSASVLLQRSRTPAIVSGQGEGKELILRFLDKSDPAEPAEVVITSGLDGVFPHGLKVGMITAIEKLPESMFQVVLVRPAVDLYHLEEVLILLDSNDYLSALPEQLYADNPE